MIFINSANLCLPSWTFSVGFALSPQPYSPYSVVRPQSRADYTSMYYCYGNGHVLDIINNYYY